MLPLCGFYDHSKLSTVSITTFSYTRYILWKKNRYKYSRNQPNYFITCSSIYPFDEHFTSFNDLDKVSIDSSNVTFTHPIIVYQITPDPSTSPTPTNHRNSLEYIPELDFFDSPALYPVDTPDPLIPPLYYSDSSSLLKKLTNLFKLW